MIGVLIICYEVEKEYWEEDWGMGEDGNILFFNVLMYNENLFISGMGVNLKLGVIYWVNQMLCLGMAVYFFIFMWLDDVYMVSMGYNYMDQEGDFNFFLQLLDGSFEYCLQIFWCFIGSVGFIINNGSFKFVDGNWELMVRVLWGGFIFVEIEYLNYGEN